MNRDIWSLVATATIVVGLLATGAYLKVSGHGEWNWLFVALAVLIPYLLGMALPRRRRQREHDDLDDD